MTQSRIVMLALAGGLCAPAAAISAEEASADRNAVTTEDYMRPTEVGLRLTPDMARAMGTMFARQALGRQYDLDEAAQKQAAERIARRIMELGHKNQKEGRDFFEYAIESLMANQGRFTPESGRQWAKLSKPLMPGVREFITNVAQDLRPLIPAARQVKFAGDMLKVGVALDAYEKKMERWADGKAKEHENPFDASEEMAEKQATTSESGESEELGGARRTAEGLVNWETTGRWRQYVDAAVSYYKLDETQKKTAESILKEMEDRAKQAMNDEWKAKLVLNRTKLHLSYRGMNLWNTPWMWQIEREYDDLLKPVRELTRELQTRLDALPTQEQRAAALAPITEKFTKAGLRE